MVENLIPALALTFFAGLATGLGSLVSYFIPKPDMRYLSVSLGFATGVMIFVAFVDLFCAAKEVIGLTPADVVFLAGMLTVCFLDQVVPRCHISRQADSHCDRLYGGGIMMTL